MILLALGVPLAVTAALAGWRARGSDWSRLAPLVGALAVVVVGGSLIGLGGGGATGWPIAVVVGPALAFVATSRARPRPTPADRWSAPVAPVAPVEPTGGGPTDGGPGGRMPSSAGSVARALGRVEARELARSPWFGVGIGFCVLLFVLFGVVFVGGAPTWQGFFHLAPWLAHPLVGLTVLACHRSVTRDRRDRTDELFDACPTTPVTRTLGFLLAAPVPVAVLATMFLALGIALLVNSDGTHGPVGLEVPADIAGGLVLAVGGVALGVALGRWVRFGLAPVVAVIAVAFATLTLNGIGDNGWHPVTVLSTAPTVEDLSPVFQDRPLGWRLVWVSGLVVLVAAVALARHRRDHTIALVTAAALAAVTIAGIGATRPMPAASAARIATFVAEPEAHQECVATNGPVQVCAFAFHHALLERVAERVEPVAAALPADLEPLTLRQRFEDELADLPPEVRHRLTARDLDRPDNEIGLGYGDELDSVVFDPGFDVALAALGIPPEADDANLPTVLAGQARGVVAIWLAGRGLDGGDTARVSTAPATAAADAFDRGSLEAADPCSVPAAVWSAQDLAAARTVLALPPDEVGAVVVGDWDRWADPGTGTDDLLAALGLPGESPYDEVEARPGRGC